MGMYTGIRFKGYVKPEFRANFEGIAMGGDWEESNDPIFNEFGMLGRAGFIPCGILSYMPDDWEEYDNSLEKYSKEWYKSSKATDGFERTWDKDTGYWAFQCSLKNYEGEIEKWFKILPYFIERIEHLEYYYEEWEFSSQYDLVDGEIKLIDKSFIGYM